MSDQDKHFKKADFFTKLINQILVLSAAGMAAGVTFLKTDGINHLVIGFVITSIVAFIVSLITGVIGMMMVIGQLEEKEPDHNQNSVRLPNLISLGSFIVGILVFLTTAVIFYATTDRGTHQATMPANEPKQECRQVDCQPADELLAKLKRLTPEQQSLISAFVDKVFPGKATAAPMKDGSKQ